jgi:GPH family glycoside/pentoside/hexuronide:cation symporter
VVSAAPPSSARSDKPAALPTTLRLGWGIGSFGGTALINGVGFLALFFLTNVAGLSPAVAGGLLFAAKLFDIVTDPLMGLLSDRVDTRWGRRRPWLILAALISAAAFVLLFHLPPGELAATLTAGVALLVYALGYTMFNIPYLAMPAEMTADYHEQSRLMSVRVVFAALGILAGGSMAPALVAQFGGDAAAYRAMSWVLALLIGGSMAASFFGTRAAGFTTRTARSVALREQVRLALANRPFLVLLAAKFLHMTGVALAIGSLLFLVTVVLQRDEAAASLFVLASTAGTMLSLPLWLSCSRRAGKRNTYMVAAAIYVPVLLTWYMASPVEHQAIYLFRGFAIGVVTGGLTLTAQAMLPDAIQEDVRISGLHREGIFTAAYSFMEKSAFAIGPLLLGLLLQAASFEPGQNVGADTDTAVVILLAAAALPAIASGLSAAVLLLYDLDRRRLRAAG